MAVAEDFLKIHIISEEETKQHAKNSANGKLKIK